MKTTRSSTWVQKLIPSSRDVLEPDALIDVKRFCKPVNLFYHLVQSSWVESRVDWCSLPKWIIAWNETIPESVTNQRVYFNQNHFWSFMILFTDERLSKVWIIDFCPNLLAANSELEHSERCQIFLHRKVHPIYTIKVRGNIVARVQSGLSIEIDMYHLSTGVAIVEGLLHIGLCLHEVKWLARKYLPISWARQVSNKASLRP